MKNNNKGFTLAELLIVVAIIAVLVAVSIPTFNSQLEKSRQSTDLANLRGAYAAAKVAELNGEVPAYGSDGKSVLPVKIGNSYGNADWLTKYSAAAYVFVYDADSGVLYPWDNEATGTTMPPTYVTPTAAAGTTAPTPPVKVTKDDSNAATTTLKARSTKIVVDTSNLPGGNEGIVQYGVRDDSVTGTKHDGYSIEKLAGDTSAAWPNMKIVVQFTNDDGVWSLKSGAIRFENVGTDTSVPPLPTPTPATP